MDALTVVDVHAHCVPPRVLEELGRHPERYGVAVETLTDGRRRLRFPGAGWTRPLLPRLLDVAARVPGLRQRAISHQLLAPWMDLVGYSLDPETGRRWSRLLNQALAEAVEEVPGAFAAVATVPLQDPVGAAAELEHAVGVLGLRAVQIGTHVRGTALGRAGLEPFWTAAVATRVVVILHPYAPAGQERYPEHGFLQLLGYPFDTTLAAASLLFDGVIERFPELRVVLVHAGGFFPYQAGRLARGWHLAGRGAPGPLDAVRWFHYDTIAHAAAPLRYLAEVAGADRLLLGTDDPFDVGDPDPVGTVRALGLDGSAERGVLGATAARLLGWPARADPAAP